MSPVTRSAAASNAWNRRHTKPEATRTIRTARATRSNRPNRLPSVAGPSPSFRRSRRFAVAREEDHGRSSRYTSGLIDTDGHDSDEEATAAPSRPTIPEPPSEPAPTSAVDGQRLTKQEVFTRLMPNYARDRRRAAATVAAAARRHRRFALPKPRRRSLFVPLKTRRWFRRSAAGLRVTPEALWEVDAAMARFEATVRVWLRQVTGPRRTPTLRDVLAVLRRSGVAGTEPELRQLIRRHYPLEVQQELIRVAESDHRLYPADNPLAAR